jgi:hypothetical protein
MFWRFLIIFLAAAWAIPRLLRGLGRPRSAGSDPPRSATRSRDDERLASLTRQEISDAEFEEAPPPQ